MFQMMTIFMLLLPFSLPLWDTCRSLLSVNIPSNAIVSLNTGELIQAPLLFMSPLSTAFAHREHVLVG
jgi:hypothetical protein